MRCRDKLIGGVGRAGFALALGACSASAQAPEPPTPTSPPQFEDFTLRSVLRDGDYLLPRISSNGGRVAFVERIVVFETPSFQLWILEPATGERTRLIDGRTALDWATYGAFPMDLRWEDNRTLAVTVSDGDVDWTEVEVDVLSSNVGATPLDPDSDSLTPREQGLVRVLRELRPYWSGLLRSHVARQSIWLGSDQTIFQKRFSGEDRDLWHLDLATGSFTQVLDFNDFNGPWLEAAEPIGGRAVLAFSRRDTVDVALVEGADVLDSRRLLDGPGATRLAVVGSGPDWDLVQIVKEDSGELSENRIFLASPDGLRDWPFPPGIREVRLAPEGHALVVLRQVEQGAVIEVYTR